MRKMKKELKEKMKRTEWFERTRTMLLKPYRNKNKWGIYTEDGELMEIFRTKRAASEALSILNKNGLGIKYIIVTIL